MVEGASSMGRAWERLAARRSFRGAAGTLLVIASLAVYAPFLANDRPYVIEGVRRGEYERALRSLAPVAQALEGLLAQGSDRAARAAEAAALRTRLATVASQLAPAERAPLEGFERELAAALASAERGGTPTPGLAQRARALASELVPARVTLVPRRSYPLLAALAPLEAGFAAGWLLVLALPWLARRLGAARVLTAALVLGLAVGLGARAAGTGAAFHGGTEKEALLRGEIEARTVLFAPVPYGYAEQHPEESLRPPTWLASSELDERGAYVRGARVPRPDAVTRFVPATRPVDVRPGEAARNSPWRHLLGTDTTGRDLLARVLHGARVSLAVGCLAAALLFVIGLTVGAVAGYFGGWLDLVLSRVIEVVVAFPLLFLVLVAVAFVGPSLWNVVLVLGCVGWTGVARLARSEFQRQRGLDYVTAARVLGFSDARIVLRHVLPNTLAPLLVAAAFAVAGAILVESTLSFLGYGVRVPVPSWGALTSESRDLSNWWLMLFPGLCLFATLLAVQLVADALRDALDPRAGGAP
jgi:peptide/nickel transport system permease protein